MSVSALSLKANAQAAFNGSFETPVTSSYAYNATGGPWTFIGNSGVQRNGSVWGAPTAPEGLQTAFLIGNWGYDTIISQSATFNNGSYTLSFKVALRNLSSIQSFDAFYDTIKIGSYAPTNTAFASATTGAFTATAGSHTIKFVDTTTSTSGDNCVFFDDVKLVASTPTPTPTPPAPTGLSATSYTGNPVYLSWNSVGGATSYDVFRSTSPILLGGVNIPITSVSTNRWTDTTASQGTPYYYVVTAKYNGASSAYSNQATVTPLATPTGLVMIPGTSKCFLSWNPVAGATGYVLTMQFQPPLALMETRAWSTTATNYTADFYSGNIPHTFSVRATNSNASSATIGGTVYKAIIDSDLATLSLAPTTVRGVDAATGTVTLTNIAPSFIIAGAKITLSSDNAAVSLPASVTIPAGATSATFPITTIAVATQQTATISAFYAGLTRTATLTLAVNRAPVAVADSASTLQNVTIDIPVLVNDTDADSDTLNVTSVTQGSKGAVSINANKTVRYVSTAGASGSDSFSYNISDGHGATASAIVTMTINVGNRAPVAGAQSVSTNEDTSKAITLAATDADGNALTYSVVTLPTKGTLSGAAPNLIYTPNLNFNGSDSFTFKANDGTVNSNVATVSVTVTPVNDAPVANAQSISATKNTAFNGTLTATDIDSTTLTYSKVANPTNGTVTIASNGSFTYAPATGYIGSDSFTFKANDGALDSFAATVSITVNSPPSGILSTLRFAPTSVVGGGGRTALGTLMLTSAAPAGGLVITLSSDKVAAQVPASVTVNAGALSAQFTVTTSTVSSVTNANIKATSGSDSITTALPVTPRFVITNVSNGNILSGHVLVNVAVYDVRIGSSSLLVSVDGKMLDRCVSSANGIWYTLIPTAAYDNGAHTLSISDASSTDSRSVSFQNVVSGLKYDSIFDISSGNTDIPSTCRIKGNIASNSNWLVSIKDKSNSVVKSFAGVGTSFSIVWDGKNSSGVQAPNGNYYAAISTTNIAVTSTSNLFRAQEVIGNDQSTILIINKNVLTNHLILIDVSAAGGQANALNYAFEIASYCSSRPNILNSPVQVIITDARAASNTPGQTYTPDPDGSLLGVNPPVVRRIDLLHKSD